MNLTGQGVYQRGQKRKPRSRPPTIAERQHWERVRSFGCSVCKAPNPEIHHALTGAGRKKDHAKVFSLCFAHHRGQPDGLHFIGRKIWEGRFGSEQGHLDRVAELLS